MHAGPPRSSQPLPRVTHAFLAGVVFRTGTLSDSSGNDMLRRAAARVAAAPLLRSAAMAGVARAQQQQGRAFTAPTNGGGGKEEEEEEVLRRDLAAAHWLTNHFKMDDLTWNHISARCSCGRGGGAPASAPTAATSAAVDGAFSLASAVQFLVTPGDRLWDDIEPEDLLLASDNVTANVIHEAIYRARPDVQAVVHLHTPAVTTVSCLKGGLRLFDQDGAIFGTPDAVACVLRWRYHEWEGLSDDTDEQERLAAALGPVAHTLIMRNHGACTTGASVGQVSLWQLENAGREILAPDPAVMQHAALQSQRDFPPGRFEWPALVKLWERKRPGRIATTTTTAATAAARL